MGRCLIAVVATLAVSASVSAQGENARGRAEAIIDGKTVVVDYGRPALQGRSLSEVMSTLPEDRMWRAGMNRVTTLKTDADLVIGGQKVPAGEYSVYVHISEAGKWSLVLNSVLGRPLASAPEGAPDDAKDESWAQFAYTREIGDKEVARATMRSGRAKEPADSFTIDLVGHFTAGTVMQMTWGDQVWSVALAAAK